MINIIGFVKKELKEVSEGYRDCNMSQLQIQTVLLVLLSQLITNSALKTINETQKIAPSNVETDFGISISMSSSNLIIGSPEYDNGKGAVYSFKYNGTRWGNEMVYIPDDAPSRQHFGGSVAVDKDRFIVGFKKDSSNRVNAGSAYIYNSSDTDSGTWGIEQKVTASDGVDGDLFGQQVAISGDFAAVSAMLDDDLQSNAGSVYPFLRTQSLWNELTKITANADTFPDAYFGSALAMNDEYLVVGAKGHSNRKGGVFLFKRSGNSFVREDFFPKLYHFNSDMCGTSVAISADRVVFSCMNVQLEGKTTTEEAGIVYVYKKNSTGDWVEETYFFPSTIGDERFGSSVGIWGNRIIVGAMGEEKAHVYDFTENGWNKTATLLPSDSQNGNQFGASMTFENGKILIGSPKNGAVYFYDMTPEHSAPVAANNETNNSTQNDDFSVECSNTAVTGYWPKSLFSGSIEGVFLANSSCNDFASNETHVWISASFDTCGSFSEQHDNFISQGNSASIKVKYSDNIIYRLENHLYNMKCMFSRTQNISLFQGGFEVTNSTSYTKTINSSEIAEYDITMSIYTSTDFLTKSPAPLKVAINEPIHIGVKKAGSTSKTKIIVEKCFATPTSSIDDDSYIFFHNKCPLDSSFQIMKSNHNDFNFVFNAFRFIQLSKSVYVHCRILICKSDSKTEQCTQTCSSRKKRSAKTSRIEISGLEVAYVTSHRIEYIKKASCFDLNCPAHSQCIHTYPAMCRCNVGYVFSYVEHKCKNERILKLNQLHLNMTWNEAYANTNSLEFMELANKTESDLMKTFTALELKEIEGVRVYNPRRGSIIFDVHVIYSRSTTNTEAFKKIVSIMTSGNEKIKKVLTSSRILTDKVVTMEEKSVKELKTYILAIIIALGLTLLLLSCIVSAWFVGRRKRNLKTIEVDGFDNKGIEVSEKSVSY